MSLWSRIANVFRDARLNRELDEEFESHIAEAVENGRDPEEARRAFGSLLRHRERSRDWKLVTLLDSLRHDALFGWRQLWKNKAVSGAAILSLALAIGACTSAFRLIDAILLRLLPVADPDRLFYLVDHYTGRDGKLKADNTFDYPAFRELRKSVTGTAELMAISGASSNGLTFGSDDEMEKFHRQYVSGWTFESFGLKPAIGRLLTRADDQNPGAHPVAVISYEYWQRRFGRDPKAVGRKFRLGNDLYEIVGVVQEGFTGTETGTLTDVFVPTMMNTRAIGNPNWGWFRTWVRVNPGVSPETVRQQLRATLSANRKDRIKLWPPGSTQQQIDEYVAANLTLESAAAGVSGLQSEYRQSLLILACVVGLVLLIATANVANLLTAQAAARSREMALRVSIGAGRWRLVQLVMIEGLLLTVLATVLGAAFAWWSAPLVVGMIHTPDEQLRLVLPTDWRVLGFGIALSLTVTLLFGLAPALRASGVKPMSALKGGENPHSRRRFMHALVAAQVAFCFIVHFFCGLFVATFERMSNRPTGFNSDRVLLLETVTKTKQPGLVWTQLADQLRGAPGVETLALASWPLMGGNIWGDDIWVGGRPMGGEGAYFLAVSPHWLNAMQIRLLEGRDFRPGDTFPGTVMVNEAFARTYFPAQSALEGSFGIIAEKKLRENSIAGIVSDATYYSMREPVHPTVYVPFGATPGPEPGIDWATLVVRTSTKDPLAPAPLLRGKIKELRSDFRVSDIRTQTELVRAQTIRERLLATLSLFFATVALLLAAVGLYGVLNYSILQRRREIGIRMALGARAPDVVRRVTIDIFAMLVVGAGAGLAAGVGLERYVDTLLYQVNATDPAMLALPALTIFLAATLAAIPPVLTAVRIDPATMLRSE